MGSSCGVTYGGVMTQSRHIPLTILAVCTDGAFIVTAFLLPRGELIAYAALWVALLGATLLAAAYAYAMWDEALEPARDETLQPAVQTYTLIAGEHTVPASLLEGAEPLVALVREGELLHPEFNRWLAPYFTEPSLAFVQSATQYRGEGRVADSFYTQEYLAQSYAAGKNSLNATVLHSSGALIARDALRAVYQPGISFEELGLRLQAAGYGTYFEPTPLVLAAAPQTLDEYWPLMLRRLGRTLRLTPTALVTRKLPLATRLQYLAGTAGIITVATSAAALLLAPVAWLLRGVGPFIVSGVSLPGLIFFALCGITALATLRILSGSPIVSPVALAVAGSTLAAYRLAELLRKQVKVQVTHLLVAGPVYYHAVLSKVLRADKLGHYLKRLGNINRVLARNIPKVEDVLLGQN